MNECLKFFVENRKNGGRVLELGTKKWGTFSTHHKSLWPDAEHIGTDFIDGEDVDVLSDAQNMSSVFGENSFEAVFSASTFEHIEKPWLAAQEIIKVLKPGGVFFVQTHNCFPIHAYPHDYWRYTTQALESLFHEAKSVVSCYEFPVNIISLEHKWESKAISYLNVCIAGVK